MIHPRQSPVKFVFQWVIIWTAVALTFIQEGEDQFYKRMPITHWFEYEAVGFVPDPKDPAQIALNDAGELEFTSTMARYRPVHIFWNDILWCDVNRDGKFTHNRSQPSDWYFNGTRKMKTTTWSWIEGYPPDTLCFVDANPSVLLSNGRIRRWEEDLKTPVFITPKE